MGLREDVDELKELMKKDKLKEKKFKIPFGRKVGKGQRRKNFVTVLIIYENGTIEFKKYKIEDQVIMHDLIPRLAASGYVTFFKGNPFIILPNWSVEPFSPLEHYQKSLINGTNNVGMKLLLAKMQSSTIADKKQMPGWIKWVIGLGLAAVIGYALITGGGGKSA